MPHGRFAIKLHSGSRGRPVGIGYLFLTLTCMITVAAAVTSTTTIGDSDNSIQYTPATFANSLCTSTDSSDCSGKWWEEAIAGSYLGSVKTTGGPGTSLQLTFQGTSIVVKGVTDRHGANALISMDAGTTSSVSFDSSDDQQHVGQVLYSMTGLSPTVNHTLLIQYDDTLSTGRRARLMRIDSFDITMGDDSSASASSSTVASSSMISSTLGGPSGAVTEDGGRGQSGAVTEAGGFTGTSTSTSTSGVASTTSRNSSSTDTPAVIGTSKKSTSTVAVVAGVTTAAATLAVASAIIFLLLRRRRAVRIQSVELPRSASAPQSPPPRMRGLANLAYAFNRRGSSVASSADAPQTRDVPPGPPPSQPLLPVPPISTKIVTPYNYRRPGPAYPRSDGSSDIGLPVDERPPNIPQPPASPAVQNPRVLRVHNPDGSTVVSSNG